MWWLSLFACSSSPDAELLFSSSVAAEMITSTGDKVVFREVEPGRQDALALHVVDLGSLERETHEVPARVDAPVKLSADGHLAWVQGTASDAALYHSTETEPLATGVVDFGADPLLEQFGVTRTDDSHLLVQRSRFGALLDPAETREIESWSERPLAACYVSGAEIWLDGVRHPIPDCDPFGNGEGAASWFDDGKVHVRTAETAFDVEVGPGGGVSAWLGDELFFSTDDRTWRIHSLSEQVVSYPLAGLVVNTSTDAATIWSDGVLHRVTEGGAEPVSDGFVGLLIAPYGDGAAWIEERGTTEVLCIDDGSVREEHVVVGVEAIHVGNGAVYTEGFGGLRRYDSNGVVELGTGWTVVSDGQRVAWTDGVTVASETFEEIFEDGAGVHLLEAGVVASGLRNGRHRFLLHR